MDTKANDTLAIIKLYEVRSETRMREARAWFMSEFNPESARQIVQLLLSGQAESASYRMVASHWEISASLVNNGGIDEKLFLDANTEHLVVFAKLQPFIEDIREILGEPDYLMHLEQLVMRVPNVEKKLENRRTLLDRWSQASTSKDRERAVAGDGKLVKSSA
jgi:hypothetical protein